MLARLGVPSEKGSYKEMSLERWNLSNGNELSATVDRGGRIVYLEADWDGKNEETGCDLPDLHFGLTTLADLRKKFGSNGLGFKNRPAVIQIPNGVVMINSFEAGSAVITFYTKINENEFKLLKERGADPSPADFAKLDAISIADDSYANSEWGERVYDPAYKKIEWK